MRFQGIAFSAKNTRTYSIELCYRFLFRIIHSTPPVLSSLCDSENFPRRSPPKVSQADTSHTTCYSSFFAQDNILCPIACQKIFATPLISTCKNEHLFCYLSENFCRSEGRVMAGGVADEQKYTPY